MAEIKKSITDFQFGVLLDIQKEREQINVAIAQHQAKQQLVIDLILDSFGLRGAQVQLNASTKELIVTIPDPITPPQAPVLPTNESN